MTFEEIRSGELFEATFSRSRNRYLFGKIQQGIDAGGIDLDRTPAILLHPVLVADEGMVVRHPELLRVDLLRDLLGLTPTSWGLHEERPRYGELEVQEIDATIASPGVYITNREVLLAHFVDGWVEIGPSVVITPQSPITYVKRITLERLALDGVGGNR